MKKKTFVFLLSVVLLVLAGCGKEKNTETTASGDTTQTESIREQTEQMEDSEKREEGLLQNTEKQDSTGSESDASSEADTKENTVSDSMENKPQEPAGKDKGEKDIQPSQPQSQPEKPAPQEPSVQKPEKSEPEVPHKPEPSQEVQPVSYSPQKVVELATEQTKAVGKIYLPDDLDRMLAQGTISKEDYDACYPTDGAGYLEFYVATDMNEARDISGTVKFNSEADIAANIAGMYGALPQQYFYIEYHGTAMYGSRECYVFYCYRA